jgi:hypothetical protein
MKMMITGRRRSGQTWAEMKAHMLTVHGPLVEQHMGGAITRYVQNHVRDAAYGENCRYGRDMVAELLFGDGPPLKPSKIIHDDEVNFAHLEDRVFVPSSEEVVIAPPPPPGRTEPPRGQKTLHYLKRAEGVSPEAFSETWRGLDARLDAVRGLKGYVRSTPLTRPDAPPPPYDGVSSLWFATQDDAAEGLRAWYALVAESGVTSPDDCFALHAEEHAIIGG